MNHEFSPSSCCAYTYLASPRLGPVVAVTTTRWGGGGSYWPWCTRAVEEGEEITVDYNYPPTVQIPWYR